MQIKRLAAAVLAALCLCLPAKAADGFAAEMEPFLTQYGLHQGNFSLCYYNTVTGEEYRYNDEKMMVAASTYKLPLNLYYYEMEARGEIAPDAYIPNSGTTLEQCHYLSLVHSDNETSMAMLYNLGNFRTYKDCMRTYFTDGEVPSQYYADNFYSTSQMLDTLKYIWEHQDELPQMLTYLKEACPDAYFKKYVTDCEIAHKYGSFEGAENDTGIFFAHQPFLLAVYTQNVGENVVARAAELAKAYTDAQYEAQLRAEEEARIKELQEKEEIARAAQEAAKAEAANIPLPNGKNFPLWILPVVSLTCCLTAIVLILSRKKQKTHP